MLIKSARSLQKIEDITAYVKNGDVYESASMKSVYKTIYNTMIGYINGADYNNGSITYLYKDNSGTVLDFFQFNAQYDYQLPSSILYNTKHWVTNKKPFTCIPVWNSHQRKWGHRGFLITKKHMVYQYHSTIPSIGTKVLFLDENNQRVYRDIVDRYSLFGSPSPGNDSGLVRLDSDVPSSIVPAMFIGYPLHHFIANNTNNKYNGNYTNTKNIIYDPFCTMHTQYRRCNCQTFGITYEPPNSLVQGWGVPNGVYDFTYSFKNENLGPNYRLKTYLNPPNSIWSDRSILGDSGHVKGFFYGDRYVLITKETSGSLMEEYEGDYTVGTSYVRYKDKIDEWEGANADNYRPEYLTVYSV